jgi:hypothetical protein
MCGWPPRCKSFLREAQRSLAVMCAAFLCGRTWTAGLDGFRGSRPYQLGSDLSPSKAVRLLSIRRVD